MAAKFKPGEVFYKYLKDNSPFVSEDGRLYVQYDQLRIKQKDQFIIVELLWQREVVGSLELHCDLQEGDVITVDYISGRTEVM